jgi:hypothetical protein
MLVVLVAERYSEFRAIYGAKAPWARRFSGQWTLMDNGLWTEVDVSGEWTWTEVDSHGHAELSARILGQAFRR